MGETREAKSTLSLRLGSDGAGFKSAKRCYHLRGSDSDVRRRHRRCQGSRRQSASTTATKTRLREGCVMPGKRRLGLRCLGDSERGDWERRGCGGIIEAAEPDSESAAQ
eukprot:1362895-Rhodomonas_salina.2